MVSLQKSAASPELIAAAWFASLATASAMPREEPVPQHSFFVLAAFAALALAQGRSLVILVPDDELLPDISNALDLSLRPLCLVLPAADFAAGIALRATLSLMKSRLQRDGDDDQSPAWQRQRERVAANKRLWEEAQAWVSSNDRTAWPPQVAELFPARVLPIAAYRLLQQKSSDITVLFRCDAPPELLAPAGSLLHVGTRAEGARQRAVTVSDETARLQMELAQLTQEVAEMELELATAQGEVAEFTRRYYEMVGRRMVELDALQATLAERRAEAAPDDSELKGRREQQRARAEQSAKDSARFRQADAAYAEGGGASTETPEASAESASFRPSADVKRLFRQIAQKIHPDRALDDADRAWRTQLMSEANRAYRAGDQQALKEVVALWEEGRREASAVATSPDEEQSPVTGKTPPGKLKRQIDGMRARFVAIEGELHRLFGSRLYELFITARQAWRQNRDLLQEMAEKLDANIDQLRKELATTTAN